MHETVGAQESAPQPYTWGLRLNDAPQSDIGLLNSAQSLTVGEFKKIFSSMKIAFLSKETQKASAALSWKFHALK